MKKTLAILLTLALVICMMPANAFADSTIVTTITDANVTLSPDVIYNGQVQKPSITVKVNEKTLTENTDYKVTWGSGNYKDAGTYTLTITGIYNDDGSNKTGYDGVVTKRFSIAKINFDDKNTTITYTGSTLKSTFKDFDTVPVNTMFNVADLASNTTVRQGGQTVSSTLYDVTAEKISVDSVRIKATLKSNDANVSGEPIFTDSKVTTDLETNYKIIGTASDGSIPDQSYNGNSQIRPTIYVVPKENQGNSATGKLTEGVHYSVNYPTNVTAGKTATVTVTGKGAYSGTISATFEVVGKSIANAQVVTYTTAKGQKPRVDVYDGAVDDANKLTENTDYTIDWSTSTVGSNKGSVTINGINNYSGKTRTYYFNVAANELKAGDATVGGRVYGTESAYYIGTTRTATTVSVKNGKIGSGNYYLEYEYTKDGKTVITKTPKDSGNYRVYVVGTGTEYAGRIFAGTFNIMPIHLDWTEIVLGSATVYDSASRTYVPKVTLRVKSAYTYGYSGYVTIPETDYNVTYRYVNYTSAYLKPTAVVTVASNAVNLTKAVDSKVTEITQEFSNATKNIAYCTASFTDGRSSSAYTGSAVTPRITVRDGYTTLDSSAYTISYKDASGKTVARMRDAGTYTIVIKGNGVYYGELTLTYTIIGTDISNYTVTLRESSVKADGFAKIPVITSVAYSYYSKLSVNDYTVSYQDSTGKTVTRMSAPGTYKVVVTGKNGYSGSCYATFRIVGLAQSVTGVKNAYKAYPTTETFKLYPQVTEGTITYTSSDPSVASVDAFGYVTPLRAGRAVITISTIGNVKYDPADKDVVIKVYPNKAKLSQKPWNTGKKGQIKVRWNKQDNVTRYQVIYSRDKSFKKGSYKVRSVNAATNSYTTQSTTVKGLYSGYTYYVKVRAIKYVYNGYGQRQVYYGNWSNWRSVKVK